MQLIISRMSMSSELAMGGAGGVPEKRVFNHRIAFLGPDRNLYVMNPRTLEEYPVTHIQARVPPLNPEGFIGPENQGSPLNLVGAGAHSQVWQIMNVALLAGFASKVLTLKTKDGKVVGYDLTLTFNKPMWIQPENQNQDIPEEQKELIPLSSVKLCGFERHYIKKGGEWLKIPLELSPILTSKEAEVGTNFAGHGDSAVIGACHIDKSMFDKAPGFKYILHCSANAYNIIYRAVLFDDGETGEVRYQLTTPRG